MENQKSKNSNLLGVIIGILVGVLLVCGAGFALYSQGIIIFDSNNVRGEDNKELDGENQQLNQEKNINYILNFNDVVNSSEKNYSLTVPSHGDGTNVSLDVSQTKVTVSLSHGLVNQTYGLGWVTGINDHTYEPHEIVFNQKVVDIYFSGFGQSSYGDTILFLMEDGTVQYLPLRKAYATDHENLKSYGTLSGVSNIVKFYTVNKTGGISLLAQDKDGKLYDLAIILSETGNY